MSTKKTALAEYKVLQAREIDKSFRGAGETVMLSPQQAKYYLPPLGSGLEPVAAGPSKARSDS